MNPPLKLVEYFVDKYPYLDKQPVPVEPYISPEYFEKEREHVFKKSWLNVAREEDLPNPGDYFVKEIEIFKTSILVMRGLDGNIRAFHNICRHRGNKLVYNEGPGNAKVISCRFHGWSYGNEGQLRFIPAEEQSYGINKNSYDLVPLGCDTWAGFVFIHYEAQPKEGLKDYLGELHDRYKDYPFAQMQCISSFSAVLKANWKTAEDAFQEAMHVPYIHGITMGDAFVNSENPHCHITWAELYKRHRTGSVFGAPQQGRNLFPTERVAFTEYAGFTQGADENGAGLPGVNPSKMDNWAFDINVVFPNVFIDPGTSQFFTMHFWPIDVHTTRWEFRLYMFPADKPAQKVAQKYTDVVMRDAGLEDLSTVETTQKALESGVLKTLPYSDQEVMLRHNLYVVEDAIKSA